MKHLILMTGAVLAPALFSGCIVLDQVTTIAVGADGSANVVVFHSNVRSTDEGAKAEEERRRYVDAFNARTSDDLKRIARAGCEVAEARWLRREPPYSTVVVARAPDAAALERLATFKDDEGNTVASTRFSRDGARRKLTTIVTPPGDLAASALAEPSPSDARRSQVNGLNETRVVVAGGRITAARGWAVSDDRGSALLNLDEVRRLLRENPRRVELFIEWDVEERSSRE